MLQTQGFAEIRAHERGVIWRMNRENKEEKSGAAHRVATVVGAVLCVILLPILIINVTLIIRSFTNRDEVPSVGGIFPLIVLTDSMYPDIQSGDLIFCHTEEPENIKIGDYIAFFDPAGNGTSISNPLGCGNLRAERRNCLDNTRYCQQCRRYHAGSCG